MRAPPHALCTCYIWAYQTKQFMKRIIGILLMAAAIAPLAKAERVLEGTEAWKEIRGAEVVRYKDFSSVPAFIKFREGYRIYFSEWQEWMLKRYFKGNSDITFELIGTESDARQMHYRYRQTSEGYPIEFGVWIVHTENGQVVSMNGELFEDVPKFAPGISEASALQAALDHIGASVYKWEIPQEEQLLQSETNNPGASYYPLGNLAVINEDVSLRKVELKLAWKFNIYAHSPMSRSEVYVDAQTGNILFTHNLIHHADSNGVAVTGYNGTQDIVADYTGSSFRLRETGRGNGIETFNMGTGVSYWAATDFTDADNFWNISTIDKYATDAHWGAEMTYDFYWDNFNRNSINGNGFKLLSYIHYDLNYGNAFWDGQRMTYGDGNNGNTPFTAIDIAGHEITHGLTTFTADLVYQDEPGALNESFSDIFGAAVEFFANGGSGDWLMGEDLGFVIRSMNNPGTYGDPDTYFGNNWYSGTADNGGVHTNSGVQNFWFYLLSQGGSGINDQGESYNVQGIGIEDAQAIAFRNLTVYLTTSSQYEDARFYAIQSALDLFGPCSQEATSTGNAWYAVGVGNPYSPTVDADFSSSSTGSCALPFEVDFYNLSSNATTYSWNFGDGGSSSLPNPSHTYTQAGAYTVSLQVSSSCGNDSKTLVDYITVGPEAPCEVLLPEAGAAPQQTGCEGVLYDNGGPTGNYDDDTDGWVTIAPCGAQNVTIYFDDFDIEPGGGSSCIYDYVSVYDGDSPTAPLLGKYCNSNPPPASLTSTGGVITIRMFADQGLNLPGFRISWECAENNAPPVADFEATYTESCNGHIGFEDLSENCPVQWSWDFGDGNTSNDQNPNHIYTQDGTYNVQLTVNNANGSNSITKTAYIVVDHPDMPAGEDVDICPGESATLIVSGSGENRWYDNIFATTPIHVGDTLVTPVLNGTTSYFVESVVPNNPQHVGPPNNSIGSGGYYNSYQHLYFDAFADVELISVKVYATGAGVRTIQLRDNNSNVLDERTVNMASGEQVIDLNFMVAPGSDYELGMSNTSQVNMYRNDGGVQFPYTINNVVSISRSSYNFDPYGNYFFFYDWQVRDLCLSERSTVTASTAVCLGVEELAREDISIYPNPSHGHFTLQWGEADVKNVEIRNAHGQVIHIVPAPALRNTEQIGLNLAAGVYFVKVVTERGALTERVVIQ